MRWKPRILFIINLHSFTHAFIQLHPSINLLPLLHKWMNPSHPIQSLIHSSQCMHTFIPVIAHQDSFQEFFPHHYQSKLRPLEINTNMKKTNATRNNTTSLSLLLSFYMFLSLLHYSDCLSSPWQMRGRLALSLLSLIKVSSSIHPSIHPSIHVAFTIKGV